MKPDEIIRRQRLALGLSKKDVYEAIGLTASEYVDMEEFPSEAILVPPLAVLKKLCKVLNVDLLELIGEKCQCCQGKIQHLEYSGQPRHLLLARRREERGLSRKDFAEQLGFEEWVFVEMEQKEDFLEQRTVDFIRKLARKLALPVQVLLAYPCPKCKQ